MVSRLWNNTASTEDVLRAFAEDLNDSTGDVVASQLILAASGRGQAGLSKALDALAETVASDVRARRQIAADQAKPRTTARTVKNGRAHVCTPVTNAHLVCRLLL